MNITNKGIEPEQVSLRLGMFILFLSILASGCGGNESTPPTTNPNRVMESDIESPATPAKVTNNDLPAVDQGASVNAATPATPAPTYEEPPARPAPAEVLMNQTEAPAATEPVTNETTTTNSETTTPTQDLTTNMTQ